MCWEYLKNLRRVEVYLPFMALAGMGGSRSISVSVVLDWSSLVIVKKLSVMPGHSVLVPYFRRLCFGFSWS